MDNIKDVLQNAKDIYVLIIFFLGIVSYKIGTIPFNFKKKKDRVAVKEGVQDLAVKNCTEEFEVIAEQKRIVKEYQELMFSDIEDLYIKKYKIKDGDLRIAQIENDSFRIKDFTLSLLLKIIYRNHLAKKEGDDWTDYKNLHKKYIFKKTQAYAKTIYKPEIMQITYSEAMQKAGLEVYEIYMKYIELIFNDMRDESKEANIEINKNIKKIDNLIYGKGVGSV